MLSLNSSCYFSQSSIINPLTLLNSRVLWVASITLWANAIDAMNKSLDAGIRIEQVSHLIASRTSYFPCSPRSMGASAKQP